MLSVLIIWMIIKKNSWKNNLKFLQDIEMQRVYDYRDIKYYTKPKVFIKEIDTSYLINIFILIHIFIIQECKRVTNKKNHKI